MFDLPGVLALLLIGLYLADSIHFLCLGEAVVIARAGRVRGLSFGGPMELGGRRPYLPNPLTPFWPELRLQWDTSGAPVQRPEDVLDEMRRELQAVRHIGLLAGMSGFLIVIVAPVASFLGQDALFVAAVTAGLVVTAANCVWLWRIRSELQLTGWQVCSMSVVAVVCLPFGANLARAVASHRRWCVAATDLPLLAQPEARSEIRERLRDVLEAARIASAEDSPEYRVIGQQLELLQGTADEPR